MTNKSAVAHLPRARAIVVLGLSKESRRFLQRIGVKTVDSLCALDADYLRRNGATSDILAELMPFVSASLSAACPSPSEQNALADSTTSSIEPPVDAQPSDDARPCFIPFYHLRLSSLIDFEANDYSEKKLEEAVVSFLDRTDGPVVVHSSNGGDLKRFAAGVISDYEQRCSAGYTLDKLLDTQLESLAFNTRARNRFEECGFRTVRDLCSFGKSNFSTMRNVGVGVIANIEKCLRSLSPDVAALFCGGKTVNLLPEPVSAVESKPNYTNGAGLMLDMKLLSARSCHALRYSGILTVEEVLDLGADGLSRIRNLGSKSIEEILLVAKCQLAQAQTAPPEREDVLANDDILIEDTQYQQNNVALTERTKDLIRDLSDYFVVSPEKLEELASLHSDDAVDELRVLVLCSLAFSFLTRHPWGLSLDEFEVAISGFDDRIKSNALEDTLQRLSAMGYAVESDGIWRSCEKSIAQAVEDSSIKESHKQIVYSRLAGATLEEIGQESGKTRERIRQIVAKTDLGHILDGTRAYGYLKLLQRYELNERELCEGLGATKEEWEAASFVYGQEETGGKRESASALLSNKFIPERVRFDLDAASHYGFVKIDGEYVKKKPLDLVLYTLRKEGSKRAVTEEELQTAYYALLGRLGLQEDPALVLSDRYISTTILRHRECVLTVFPSKMRYYDCSLRDIDSLIKLLPFNQYQGKEFSTRVFVRDCSELMQEYEIEDEYELHSILRYYYEIAEKGQ